MLAATATAAGPEQHAQVEFLNGEEAAPQPKKKHWYNRRKNRRLSESDAALSAPPPPPPSQQDAGRSFVVMRKPRPGFPGASYGSESSSSAQPAEGVDEQGRRSFAVLRGPTHSDPQRPGL